MRIKVLSGGRKSIELPLSDAELNFQMKRIGIEEIVPVCRLVEASEKDRKIVILPTEDVESEDVPKELLDICADLGIPREKVNIVLRMTEEENGKK